MPFGEACLGEGVQPIIGAMLAVARPDDIGTRGSDRLAGAAGQDEAGYDNLCRLVSAAHLDRPSMRILTSRSRRWRRHRWPDRADRGRGGALARLFADGQADKARGSMPGRLKALFPERLYIESRGAATRSRSGRGGADRPRLRAGPAAGGDQPRRNMPSPSFHAAHDAMLCIAASTYVETTTDAQLA